MKKRVITAFKANKKALFLAAFLLIMSYILCVTSNIMAIYDHLHICVYLLFFAFVGAVQISCIALSGFIFDLLNLTQKN